MQSINNPPGPSGSASSSPMDVESSNKKSPTKKQIGADFSGRSVDKVTKTQVRRKSFIFRDCSFKNDFRSRKCLAEYVAAELKCSATSRSKYLLANAFARLLIDEVLKVPNNVNLPDDCATEVVENFVNECNSGKIQPPYSPVERRTMTSEFIASELASYLPVESEVAVFLSESEEIVKTIAAKLEAEKSSNFSLPDGWGRVSGDPVYPHDCTFEGYIVDNNGMPRISYSQKDIIIKNPDIPACKPNQTIEEALLSARLRLPWKAAILSRKRKCVMTTRILSFEHSSTVQSLWKLGLQREKDAREDLEKLMGCQVAEILFEVQFIISSGRLDYNHVDSLTRHVNSILDWCNERNNKEKLFQFLRGKHRYTKLVTEVFRVVEMFVKNNDLPLIKSIFYKVYGCKSMYKRAERDEGYVYSRWMELRYYGESEDKFSLSCLTSGAEEDHCC